MNLDLGLTRKIILECARQQLNLWECAYVLATAYWESGKTMEPVREAFYLGAKSEAYRRKLRYYPFYGRGLVQLTWEDNYLKAGRFLGVDFVNNPDLVMQPEYSVTILVTGMRKGWFTGVELDDHIDAIDESDSEDGREFEGARKGVNGTDRKKEIAALALRYEADLKNMGYVPGPQVLEEKPVENLNKGNFWINLILLVLRLLRIVR